MEADDTEVETNIIRKNMLKGDLKTLIKRIRDVTLSNYHCLIDLRIITYPSVFSYVKNSFVFSSGDTGYKMDCRPYNVSSQYSLFRMLNKHNSSVYQGKPKRLLVSQSVVSSCELSLFGDAAQ